MQNIITKTWNSLAFNGKYLSEFALQLFFPANCMSCDAFVAKMGSICSECFMQMQMLGAPECRHCGQPFAFDASFGEQIICDNCTNHPPSYDIAKALWAYDDYSGRIVKHFKFADKTQLAPYLGQLLASRGADLIAGADIIAPVPLHFKRLRERRYNQAALLCKHLNTPKLCLDLLIRTRYTTPQIELPFNQRQENVKGVFRVNPKYARKLEGKNILLVDDVITTGATLNACASALKIDGADKVFVLTLTKRLLDDSF
jgi:ComF family protein